MSTRTFHHFAEYHRPRFYRYEVAAPGFRLHRNVYPVAPPRQSDVGTAWIGLCLVMGRYAYCVKWAHARIRIEETR
jgi:hypothetical protein